MHIQCELFVSRLYFENLTRTLHIMHYYWRDSGALERLCIITTANAYHFFCLSLFPLNQAALRIQRCLIEYFSKLHSVIFVIKSVWMDVLHFSTEVLLSTAFWLIIPLTVCLRKSTRKVCQSNRVILIAKRIKKKENFGIFLYDTDALIFWQFPL